MAIDLKAYGITGTTRRIDMVGGFAKVDQNIAFVFRSRKFFGNKALSDTAGAVNHDCSSAVTGFFPGNQRIIYFSSQHCHPLQHEQYIQTFGTVYHAIHEKAN